MTRTAFSDRISPSRPAVSAGALCLVLALVACSHGRATTNSTRAAATRTSSLVPSDQVTRSPTAGRRTAQSTASRSAGASPSSPSPPASSEPSSTATSGGATSTSSTISGSTAAVPVESGISSISREPTSVSSSVRPAVRTVDLPAGPTVDNQYAETWGQFTRPKQCAEMTNGSVSAGVHVSLSIAGVRAAKGLGFSFFSPSATFTVVNPGSGLDSDGCYFRDQFALLSPLSCGTDVVLPFSASAPRAACLLGVETDAFANQVDASGSLVYHYDVTCTSKSSAPCSDASVVAPSAASPVHVRWSSTVSLIVCAVKGDPSFPQCG